METPTSHPDKPELHEEAETLNVNKASWMSICLWLAEYDTNLNCETYLSDRYSSEKAPATDMPPIPCDQLEPFDLTDLIHFYIAEEFGLNNLSNNLLDKLTKAVLEKLQQRGIDSLDALEAAH